MNEISASDNSKNIQRGADNSPKDPLPKSSVMPNRTDETLDGSIQASRSETVLRGTADRLTGSLTPEATQDFAYDVDKTQGYVPNQSGSLRSAPMPKSVGDYDIQGVLGRGGMGVVYRAKHRTLHRYVALKMILAGSHASPEHLERFTSEAKAVAQLQHPNIVQIFEVGKENNLPYFSLEFVDGGGLERLLRGKPIALDQAAELIEVIARAMQYAHDHGVLHRDLKPANVLLTRAGVPKITDFGLAKRLEDGDDSASTRTGTIMGTPSYMSPEQARGDVREITAASDQYSLGAMLYEMLTGRPPFVAAKAFDTILQVINSEPIAPHRLTAKLPVDLETICLKALQKEIAGRYPSCAALADDLARFRRGEPIVARPVSSFERTWRWCWRNPVIASLTAASLFLLLGTAAVSTYSAITLSAKNAEIERTNKDLSIANGLADKRREIAETKTREAEASRKLAEENADVAKKQALASVMTIQSLVGEVNERLNDAPATLPLKKEILLTAKRNLDRIPPLLIDPQKTSVAATDLAFHQSMGSLYYELGEVQKALEFSEKCRQIAEIRVQVRQGSNASRRNLAGVYELQAVYTQEASRNLAQAQKLFVRGLQLRQEIIDAPKRDPDSKPEEDAVYRLLLDSELAESHANVATTFLRVGNVNEAAQYFGVARQLRQKVFDALTQQPESQAVFGKFIQKSPAIVMQWISNNLSKSMLAMGEIAYREGNMNVALEEYRTGLDLAEKIIASGQNTAFRLEYARAIGNLGDLYLHRGEFPDAKSEYDRAIDITQELAKNDPNRVIYDRYLGLHNYRLGCLADHLQHAEEAANYFATSVTCHRRVYEVDIGNERRRAELMLALAHTDGFEEAIEFAQSLLSKGSLDCEMLIDGARCYAQCSRRAGPRSNEYIQRARELLSQARALGFNDDIWLKNELDLKPLLL